MERADLAEQMGQPDRGGARDLDLHQNRLRGEERFAVVAGAQVQRPVPPPQVRVKGDPQLRVLPSRKGGPIIGNEHLGRRVIAAHKPVDLPANLIFPLRRGPVVDVRYRVSGGHHRAAFIDYAVIFLFQLYKYLIPVAGNAVTAHPQLFLVDRLLQRRADQPEIIGVIIDVADGVAAELVGAHMVFHTRQHPGELDRRQHILFFIPLEAELHFPAHRGPPSLLSGNRITAFPKVKLKNRRGRVNIL